MIRIRENFTRYYVSRNGVVYDKQRHRVSSLFKSTKYIQCRLVDDDKVVHIMGVYVAVAMFHADDYFPGCVVHHKDGNTKNNHIDNLSCLDKITHAKLHANPEHIKLYTKQHGAWNKGLKMSADFCKKCSDSAKKRKRRKPL